MLLQVVTEDNFHNLMKMPDTVFDNTEANIKKGKKRQKKIMTLEMHNQ